MRVSYIIKFFSLLTLLASGRISAQSGVGINTNTPTALLDVEGTVLVDQKLFLEDPGDSDQIRGSKLLIQKTDKDIVQYDIDISKYGPINYAEFVFQNTSNRGVRDYDTKISTTDYIVTVQGYYFLQNGTNSTNVVVNNNTSTSSNDWVEGYQVYSYKNTTTNTWFIRASPNRGTFILSNGNAITVDIYMNLIIFRNKFIAKEINARTVNMGGNATFTTPPPAGF